MKKILMTTAAVLTLCGGTALAQMQGAPADQDQNLNRHMQSVPEKGQQQAGPQAEPIEKAVPQMQQGSRPMPSGEMREQQSQNVREERHEQQGGARITATKVLNGGEKERIHQTVIESGSAPRVENLNFSVRVGVAIPRTVRVVPVPQEIVAIYPQWNGFLYFVSGDEIIVVDPNSYAIVGVLEA
jgi:hypothetical protein